MAQINLLFPILPGQKEAHQALLAQITGEKRAEFDARCRRLGVNWERGFYQETPHGTLFLLVVDADMPEQFLPKLMEAPTAFEQWFMAQVGPIHGITPEAIKQGQPPEHVLTWHAPGHATTGKPNAMMAVPVLQVGEWKAFCHELLTKSAEAFAAERARLGVTRETHFLHQTPMGAFTAIALEGQGMAQFLQKMAHPVDAFGRAFLEHAARLNGFTPEVAAHMTMPTPVYDYDLAASPAATH